MAKRDYPVPCIKFADLPTGEKFVYEGPSGHTVPFMTEIEAKEYVLDNKIHRKYGRVFIQTDVKRFATLITDDRVEEGSDESTED